MSKIINSENENLFFNQKIMPCCQNPVKFFKGPQGGLSVNIKCAHCGQYWNFCFEIRYIEKI